MSDLNKTLLIGRLTQNPESRIVQGSGNTVVNFSIATNQNWTDKSGAKKQQVEYHNIEVWGKLAEICNKYLTKGKQVFLSGRLKTNSWEDNGIKKYKTSIVLENMQMLGSKSDDNTTQKDTTSQPAPANNDYNQPAPEEALPEINLDNEEEINIEDVPF